MRKRLVLCLMFASGFACLAYQIVWTQQCSVWLGHETAAVLAVVAAFFGGQAFGASTLGTFIERSARPAAWYAVCELVIAAWSIAFAFLVAPIGGWVVQFTGAEPAPAWQWSVAFCTTFVLLLPATAAMGATLPAMEQVMTQIRREGASIAALYASNTFGAMAGVLASAFWLVPELGLARTTGLCAAINVLCGLAVLMLRLDAANRTEPARTRTRNVAWLLAATGLLGIGYEVVVVRVLSQVTEDTVYTFALLLAVYLAGTAIGAAIYRRWLAGTCDPAELRDRLLGALAAACLLAMAGLFNAEAVKSITVRVAGTGMAAGLAAETALALVAFGLPTLAMGALFSHLTTDGRTAGISFARSLAYNTIGGAAAPLVFGVLLVPASGFKFALLSIVGGYLVLISRRRWRTTVVTVPAAATLVLALWAPPLAFVDVPTGGHIVSYSDGAIAAVTVVEDARGVMRLRIDNRQQEGSSDSRIADARQALLPLLLHPAPRRALFLGLGTGVTANAASEDPTLDVDAVELLPEVIAASEHFTRASINGERSPRLHAIAADARRYVQASPQKYDVVVADNYHPARSGSGSLYTVEHFRAVQQRLAPGGLFCQWLPLHQLDLATLRAIVRSFVIVYPGAWAMIATNSLETPVIGLIAGTEEIRFDADRVRERMKTAAWPFRLEDYGLNDEFALLGSFVAGPRSLARYASGSAANTDDRPVVAYKAPRITYAPETLPRDRLIALLNELALDPAEVLAEKTDAATRQRLAAYWSARARYIEIGRDVRPVGDVSRMLAQVREPLLGVLRISPDFSPAYEPLLRMATALARSDTAAAGALLTELSQVLPMRAEAAQALSELRRVPP